MKELPNEEGRYNTIDSLKGIAMILIVLTHYDWSDAHRMNPLFPFLIDMAVPLMMFCTGFLWAIGENEESIYELRRWYKKLLRFLLPFLIAFVPDCYYAYKTVAIDSLQSAVNLFIIGGRGPGAYYTPVMIQIVFLFPIICGFVKRYKEKGLFVCLFANLFMELCKNAFFMSEDTYRLLGFRYVFVIAAGCYFFLYGRGIFENLKSDEWNKTFVALIIMLLVGTIFIVTYKYQGWNPKILNYWTGTSCLACCYAIPLAVIYILYAPRVRLLELIGRCSWGVFIVQRMYYKNMSPLIYQNIASILLRILISLAISLGLGVAYDELTRRMTRRIIVKLDKGIGQ